MAVKKSGIIGALGIDSEGSCRKISERLYLLPQEDRTMLELYLSRELAIRDLARLSGQPERLLARRLRRLVCRLLSDHYFRLHRQRKILRQVQLAIAYDHYLLGHSYERIAARHGVTVYEVRKTIKYLRTLLRRETG